MINVTPEKLRVLTTLHIARHEAALASAHDDHSVHVEDTQHYLGIWRGIEAKGCDWAKLAPFERAEVLDALGDKGPAGDPRTRRDRRGGARPHRRRHPPPSLAPAVPGPAIRLGRAAGRGRPDRGGRGRLGARAAGGDVVNDATNARAGAITRPCFWTTPGRLPVTSWPWPPFAPPQGWPPPPTGSSPWRPTCSASAAWTGRRPPVTRRHSAHLFVERRRGFLRAGGAGGGGAGASAWAISRADFAALSSAASVMNEARVRCSRSAAACHSRFRSASTQKLYLLSFFLRSVIRTRANVITVLRLHKLLSGVRILCARWASNGRTWAKCACRLTRVRFPVSPGNTRTHLTTSFGGQVFLLTTTQHSWYYSTAALLRNRR